MTRVVAGALGGRRLRVPGGRSTRPTSDRVREALFSTLADRVADARVLDLYAGSGALGIEALSRGAAHATFVEQDPRAVGVLRQNLASLGLEANVHTMDVSRFVRDVPGTDAAPYDLVLCDPPYASPVQAIATALVALARHGRLARDAMMVVERPRHGAAFTVADDLLAVTDARTYGDTVLYYLATRYDEARGTDLDR